MLHYSKSTQRNKQIAVGRKKFNMDPKKVSSPYYFAIKHVFHCFIPPHCSKQIVHITYLKAGIRFMYCLDSCSVHKDCEVETG